MYLKVLKIIVSIYVIVYEFLDMLTSPYTSPDQLPLISSMTFLTPTARGTTSLCIIILVCGYLWMQIRGKVKKWLND